MPIRCLKCQQEYSEIKYIIRNHASKTLLVRNKGMAAWPDDNDYCGYCVLSDKVIPNCHIKAEYDKFNVCSCRTLCCQADYYSDSDTCRRCSSYKCIKKCK